jgi:hypothetical protein
VTARAVGDERRGPAGEQDDAEHPTGADAGVDPLDPAAAAVVGGDSRDLEDGDLGRREGAAAGGRVLRVGADRLCEVPRPAAASCASGLTKLCELPRPAAASCASGLTKLCGVLEASALGAASAAIDSARPAVRVMRCDDMAAASSAAVNEPGSRG